MFAPYRIFPVTGSTSKRGPTISLRRREKARAWEIRQRGMEIMKYHHQFTFAC